VLDNADRRAIGLRPRVRPSLVVKRTLEIGLIAADGRRSRATGQEDDDQPTATLTHRRPGPHTSTVDLSTSNERARARSISRQEMQRGEATGPVLALPPGRSDHGGEPVPKNYAAGLEMHCPGSALFQSGPAIPVMFVSAKPAPRFERPRSHTATGVPRWTGVGDLCAGEGPTVGMPSRAARAADRRQCSARSDMMLELPHFLQASQAEIPIQLVDEIPHDLIPLVQRPRHYAGFVSGRLRGFWKTVSLNGEWGGDPGSRINRM